MSYHIIFTYAPIVVWLLTCLLFVRSLRLKTRAQAIWAAALLLCFAKFLCFAALGGSIFTPDLPAVVIWAWDWLYSGAMILFALSLVIFFRFPGKAWALPLIAWGLSAWGLWNGVKAPGVAEVEIAFRQLPPELDGYRIVQLADVHCSSAARRWRTQAIVDAVNALDADLICLTGDNVDGSVERQGDSLAPINDLRAKDGVLACSGNHEYYSDYHDWRMRFYDPAKRIRFLTNECVFPRKGLAVGGVPDPVGWNRGLDEPPSIAGAFASATNGEFRVLLQHRPMLETEDFREEGVDLQLSGHTHGGIAPILRALVARFNLGFVCGLYRFGDRVLYVSPGCGQWAGFPMRFFNPSEITLIRLSKAK